jgi:hypothetical protein
MVGTVNDSHPAFGGLLDQQVLAEVTQVGLGNCG